MLALDTASPAITAAVHDGTRVVGEAGTQGATAHGELLAPVIRDALSAAGVTPGDLSDIAVGVGPGPFTGLRVGVVTARTLASTLGLTMHGVCSLDVLAAEVDDDGEFLVATDARRKEVYWATYSAGRRLVGPEVSAAADLPDAMRELPAYGRGAALYADSLRYVGGPIDPSAAVLAGLVVSGLAHELPAEPLYLRRPDAQPRTV